MLYFHLGKGVVARQTTWLPADKQRRLGEQVRARESVRTTGTLGQRGAAGREAGPLDPVLGI